MSIFDRISDIVGLPEDQIRLVTGFLVAVPAGFLFQNLKSRQLRVTVGTILGILLTLMVYQERIINVLIQTVIVWVMVKVLKDKCALPVFIETLVYVSVHHIYRQVTDYGGWKMDITTILMMNTCKWTAFAWCVQDGYKDEAKLSADQKLRRIQKLPSFFEYFAYCFFYLGCLAGPAYDYYEWDEFMDLKGVYSQLPSTKVLGLEALKKLRNAIVCAVFMILGQIYFPVDYIAKDEYGQHNFIFQVLYLQIMITLFRTKYLTGWSFSEAGVASSGFSFNGWDQNGKPAFDRIRSIDLWVDTTYNPQEKVRMWNISVQHWLRRYIYFRVHSEEALKGHTKKQNQAQMATYLISAFWHGFYPGYYLSFIQWGIINANAKWVYKAAQNTSYFRFFQKNPVGQVYNFRQYSQFMRFFWVNYIFNVFGCGFVLLSIGQNISFFNNIWWIPNIINIVLFIFFSITGFGQRTHKKKE